MSDGSNSAGQLRSIVERVERLDELWAAISDDRAVYEYCWDRAHPYVRRRDDLAATLFHRVGLMLGVASDTARHIVSAMSRHGGLEGYERWREGFRAEPLGPSCARVGQVGFVYYARLLRYPHVLKIGFSRFPVRREAELEAEFDQGLRIEEIAPGTVIDEVCEHIAAGRRYIRREFVFAPEHEDVRPGQIPPFLLDAPFRHISEV
jgi:hypothetical protein